LRAHRSRAFLARHVHAQIDATLPRAFAQEQVCTKVVDWRARGNSRNSLFAIGVLESRTRNFLIRIRIGNFHTVCTYEKSDTLIHWYGISLIQVQQAYSASRQCSLTRAHTTNKQLNPARVWRRASFERHSCARSEGVG